MTTQIILLYIEIFYKNCGHGKYSQLNQGVLRFNYGSQTTVIFPGIMSEKHEYCKRCPSGATCVDGNLKPRLGFWGLTKANMVELYECPYGYCCDGKK